jgi:hypothetical protein
MGYCHNWKADAEIDQELFSRIAADVQAIVLALDDLGVRLAGPLGTGLPEIESDYIAFNGLRNCGHEKNREIFIPFPAPEAAGIDGSTNAVVGFYGPATLLRHRTCNGSCSYETFRLRRSCTDVRRISQRRYFDWCKTGFRPYDLAVQCVLLIAKHHLRDRIRVTTDGTDFHWNDARLLCYSHLQYPLAQYRVDAESCLVLAPSMGDA